MLPTTRGLRHEVYVSASGIVEMGVQDTSPLRLKGGGGLPDELDENPAGDRVEESYDEYNEDEQTEMVGDLEDIDVLECMR